MEKDGIENFTFELLEEVPKEKLSERERIIVQLRFGLNTKDGNERTQKEVAEACNISIAALAMYETGQRIPRDEVKVRLANYYHRNVQTIFFTA